MAGFLVISHLEDYIKLEMPRQVTEEYKKDMMA